MGGPLYPLRGDGSSLAAFIEQHSPVLGAAEEVHGLACEVVECRADGDFMRFWICPNEDFVLLRKSQVSEAPVRGEYVETAVRIDTIGDVKVVTASRATSRYERPDGTEALSARVICEVSSLRAVEGDGLLGALRAAVMPPGTAWEDRRTGETGHVGGSLAEWQRLLLDPGGIEIEVGKYDAQALQEQY